MSTSLRPVGIHVRLYHGLSEIIQAVEQLQLKAVQSFLMKESTEYITINDRIRHDFIKAKERLGFLYFVHAAYWSGLTDKKSRPFISLQKEVEIAQWLQSDGIVVHPGATKAGLSKKDQLLYISECVNELNFKYPDIVILLENGPHAGRSFGGDIESFALLMERIEHKNLVGFCFDTAHAFVFGYDFLREQTQQDFIRLLDQSIGKESLRLLHFNDSKERCGSYIDRHEIPGAGLIGKKTLQFFMNHDLFKDVPIIIELPGDCEQNDATLIKEIEQW